MPRRSVLRFVGLLIGVASLAVFAFAADDEEVDYYDVLELSNREDSSDKDIKSNWRRLSRENHPDLKGEEVRGRYVKIQRAYEVLSDRKKRIVYEMKGEEGLKELEKPGGGRQQDPLMAMFGFGGGSRGGAGRGDNVHLALYVTLEDLYNGASHEMRYNKKRLCRKCRGTGADPSAGVAKCSTCKGRGIVRQRVQIMPGFVQESEGACPKCNGKGKRYKGKCPQCKGGKVTKVSHTLHIEIDPGSPENHEVVFEMEADQAPDRIPGDVIFAVHSAPHDRFSRNGNDLTLPVRLTLEEALLGFDKSVRHLDGREVEFSEEGVTQHGQKRVVPMEGMPVHNVPSERGKLTLQYSFDLPPPLTAGQKEKIRQLL